MKKVLLLILAIILTVTLCTSCGSTHITSEETSDGEPILVTTAEYYYDSDGSFSWGGEYEYDSDGNIIAETYYYSEGVIDSMSMSTIWTGMSRRKHTITLMDRFSPGMNTNTSMMQTETLQVAQEAVPMNMNCSV